MTGIRTLGRLNIQNLPKDLQGWLVEVDRTLRVENIVANLAPDVAAPADSVIVGPAIPGDLLPPADAGYVQAAQQLVVDRVNTLLTLAADMLAQQVAVIGSLQATIAKQNEIIEALSRPIGG